MKICEWCGEEIPKEEIKSGTQKYHKECGEKSRKERAKEKRKKAWENKTLICEWCGKEITWEGYRRGERKYHKECYKVAARKSYSEYMKEKRRKARKNKSLICAWCGEKINWGEISHGAQKYHKECRKMVYAEQLAQDRESRKKARDSKTVICAWCGEEITKEKMKHGRRKYHKECYKIVARKRKKERRKEKRKKAIENKTFICAWCGEEIPKEEITSVAQKYHKKCRPLRDRRERRRRNEQYKYIYFMRSATGLIKIGRTINIKRRYRQIQCTSPVKVTVLYVFHGSEYIEKDLHDKFEHLKSNVSPLHTEWFYDSLEIHEEIESLKKQYGQVKIKLNAHTNQ